jgi:hypothetical protein
VSGVGRNRFLWVKESVLHRDEGARVGMVKKVELKAEGIGGSSVSDSESARGREENDRQKRKKEIELGTQAEEKIRR